MRDARATDWMRRLTQQRAEWKINLTRFAVTSLPSVGTLEFPILSPFTVLAGPNGSGKSTLLRAMWAALDADSASEIVELDQKLGSGSATVNATNMTNPEKGESIFSGDGIESVSQISASITYIDSAASTPVFQKTFCRLSFDEIVNGAGARELDEKNLSEICYILNRDYTSITLYEVELDVIVPFFVVTYGGLQYDSRTMGAGEISALFIWWAATAAQENSILLIEEPEAFLSSRSQYNLAKFLLGQVVQRRLVCVVSSHSPSFINTFPKDCLVFFARTPNGVQPIEDSPPPVILRSMGIEPTIRVFAFVEDSFGRLFLRAILEKIDPFLSREVHIEQKKGDGEVVKSLKALKDVRGPIRFVGVFDGDMRGKVLEEILGDSVFLPGVQPLEIMFRSIVAADPVYLGDVLGKRNITAVLASLEGKDHHDWYEELCRELGLTRDQLFSFLFNMWFRSEPNQVAATEFHASLINIISRTADAAK